MFSIDYKLSAHTIITQLRRENLYFFKIRLRVIATHFSSYIYMYTVFPSHFWSAVDVNISFETSFIATNYNVRSRTLNRYRTFPCIVCEMGTSNPT